MFEGTGDVYIFKVGRKLGYVELECVPVLEKGELGVGAAAVHQHFPIRLHRSCL